MWQMTSTNGRWVRFDDQPIAVVTASDAGLAARVSDPAPVEVAPMSGQFHTPPAGRLDSLAVFLRAGQILGDPAKVTGQPPKRPTVIGSAAPNLTF